MDSIFDEVYTVNGHEEFTSISDILGIIKERKIEFLDLKFVDLFGRLQHYTITADRSNEELFAVGTGFDGSSIRGFQHIHESDM
jgi:glutamine synthetase